MKLLTIIPFTISTLLTINMLVSLANNSIEKIIYGFLGFFIDSLKALFFILAYYSYKERKKSKSKKKKKTTCY